MGLVHYALCVVLILCVFDTNCNLNNFFENLPAEFEYIVSNAWKGIVKAIKYPRLRKPKRNKKGKFKTSTKTTEINWNFLTEIEFDPVTDSYRVKPTIPVLHQPEWKSMLHWRNLQKPYLLETAKSLEQKGNVKTNGISQYEDSFFRK